MLQAPLKSRRRVASALAISQALLIRQQSRSGCGKTWRCHPRCSGARTIDAAEAEARRELKAAIMM